MKLMCLTDSPRVVELKREFRDLDGRVEELKLRPGCDWLARAELCRIMARKAEIAREIFLSQ